MRKLDYDICLNNWHRQIEVNEQEDDYASYCIEKKKEQEDDYAYMA